MELEKVNGGILEKGDITEGETTEQGSVINASGHTDQLTRQYGLVGLTGIAVTVNNAWVVLGSSISVSILSGGISGVIYGLIVALRRCLSLGDHSCRTQMGSCHRLLYWMDQLLWLDVRSRISGPSRRQRWCSMLCHSHSWLLSLSMACLCRVPDRHLAQCLRRHFLESTCSLHPETWPVPRCCRWSCDNHHRRCHAVKACF
ncbi:hypothetical protein LB505_007518 [Fusarium chuoi]|nr:hypothetical protein LB505_007518 [Fusarium chuoi]